jgi:hypothetical protein
MPTFLYDVKGTARIAISAATEEAARSHLPQIGMFIEPTDEQVSEYNEEHSSFQMSQIVLGFDTNQADLAKIDGEDVADHSYIVLAQGKGLEIHEVAGGWRGQHDEDWVTDTHASKGAVAREWCQDEGYEP